MGLIILNLGLQKSVVAEAIALVRARMVVIRALFRTLIAVISALSIGQLGDRITFQRFSNRWSIIVNIQFLNR